MKNTHPTRHHQNTNKTHKMNTITNIILSHETPFPISTKYVLLEIIEREYSTNESYKNMFINFQKEHNESHYAYVLYNTINNVNITTKRQNIVRNLPLLLEHVSTYSNNQNTKTTKLIGGKLITSQTQKQQTDLSPILNALLFDVWYVMEFVNINKKTN